MFTNYIFWSSVLTVNLPIIIVKNELQSTYPPPFFTGVWTVVTYGFFISLQITQRSFLEVKLEINMQLGFQMKYGITIDFLRGRANDFTK